jgi:hypothetical protein
MLQSEPKQVCKIWFHMEFYMPLICDSLHAVVSNSSTVITLIEQEAEQLYSS